MPTCRTSTGSETVTVHRWGNTTFAEMPPALPLDPPAGSANLREGIGMPMHLLPG